MGHFWLVFGRFLPLSGPILGHFWLVFTCFGHIGAILGPFLAGFCLFRVQFWVVFVCFGHIEAIMDPILGHFWLVWPISSISRLFWANFVNFPHIIVHRTRNFPKFEPFFFAVFDLFPAYEVFWAHFGPFLGGFHLFRAFGDYFGSIFG